MPELPEVITTVKELSPDVLGKKIINVWTDFEKMFKPSFPEVKRGIINKTIKNLTNRGKRIIFELSPSGFLVIHQKLTGHLLYGQWVFEKNNWFPKEKNSFLADSDNRFIHILITLNKGQIAFSDLRKFGSFTYLEKIGIDKSLSDIGIEPIDKNFTFQKFKEIILHSRGKIKKVLMDQTKIAGLGNIYSDESLFLAKISPLREVGSLKENELKELYQSIKKIISLAIKTQGESISDYRRPSGAKGGFDKYRKVYHRETCPICGSKIISAKVNGRTAHFCPKCQK